MVDSPLRAYYERLYDTTDFQHQHRPPDVVSGRLVLQREVEVPRALRAKMSCL